MSFWSIAAAFGAAVLVFDASAATIAQKTGVDYRRFAIGSVLLYAMAGAAVAFGNGLGSTWPAEASFGVGLVLGVIDSTVGWGISAAIGPGRPSNTAKLVSNSISKQGMVIRGFLGTIVMSALVAWLVGLLTSVIAR